MEMGSKTFIMFASWAVSYLADRFSYFIVKVFSWLDSVNISPELSVNLILGSCMGYNLWLLWFDQEKIIALIEGLYLIHRDKLKHNN